jgi:chromosome partitioning protein
MIILFANQKGGVGKSTLAVLFSNYLSLVKNKNVVVYDMDFQRSIFNKAQAAQILENPVLYSVVPAELAQFDSIYDNLKNIDSQFSIIDLAGKMDDDNLIPVFSKADLVLCPFSYDEYSVSSTLEFSFVINAINKNLNIIYIPNRVKSNVKYETLNSVHDALKNFGGVTTQVPDRIDFQRISTYETPASIIKVVSPIFESIYNEFIDLYEYAK